MFHRYTIAAPLLFTSFLLASGQGFEYRGIPVNTVDTQGKVQQYIVKRNIPKECKTIPINNDMLWTGNFAHKSVPEACKSTYVHTKGKLLSMHLDEDLETYGELEVLYFIKEMQYNKQMLLVDSRTEKWFNYRTIPGAINMPFNYFQSRNQFEFHFEYAIKHLGVTRDADDEFDFSNAKILVLFCNGPWCNQSPNMIFALLKIGYPAEKLKWYRGGMQDWLGAGMTSTRK